MADQKKPQVIATFDNDVAVNGVNTKPGQQLIIDEDADILRHAISIVPFEPLEDEADEVEEQPKEKKPSKSKEK